MNPCSLLLQPPQTWYHVGGARRDRTADLLRARQALSQLSYGPMNVVGLGRFELPTSPLSGVRSNQLSYRPASSEIWGQSKNSVFPLFRLGNRAVLTLTLNFPVAAGCNILGNLCWALASGRCLLFKGGDPAAGSPTATLLRLHPSHESHRGNRPP
jgi:hypothetical protein